MYDAIVVGARCAGSPTAMLLARKGYRVLLVDKATFPSDAVSPTSSACRVCALKRGAYWTRSSPRIVHPFPNLPLISAHSLL